MKYNYEALNDQSFQQFAQALLISAHPDTICLPVRQPDGGRDALNYQIEPERQKFVVFQIKFSTNPKAKTEREAIENLIKSEHDKVQSLIERGAVQYYFITNVQGTAHPDTGSIDRINKVLTEAFNIPTFVWWRDDLDARLDNASDIKWSYLQICSATDILQFLLERPGNIVNIEAIRAINAYMGKQHGDDRNVKFNQVSLKRQLTDLFVDIPIGYKNSYRGHREGQHAWHRSREVAEYLEELYDYEDFDDDDDDVSTLVHDGLAAGFLLHMPFGAGVSRFVLEGAPGQGKSTVTQFICQINRMKLIPRVRASPSSVAEDYDSAPIRAPFRVDLRDFAAWISGRHPYTEADQDIPPPEGQRSLEGFLTMQVSWTSGGLTLQQHDLVSFFAQSHSVIVLDGFDEVADIASRARIVEEICAAADRLDAHALSLQLIVTSRPAAFANSPGFPEDDWVHLELNDLSWQNISSYREKWSSAHELTPEEDGELARTLREKLRLPHLRDLSRNPMQLAILLHLMNAQGAALPDKRTALYEEYMKMFLNREVEKKQIAGDHRDLILSIHGLLAWLLQSQAEVGEGSGSISVEALRAEVDKYLRSEEHDPELANRLLKGTVERVGVLVSRVQGTFEFEVQPLREYFAAGHLYKTSPYSPAGRERRGTRPERFLALARSPYWTNVTRFFCGFYDVGELPSLVDELVCLGEEPEQVLISHTRRLAMMLLGDYVFMQSPKGMRRLVNYISGGDNFQRLTAAYAMRGQRGMRLPSDAGGRLLFEACGGRSRIAPNGVRRRELHRVMAVNGDVESRKRYWREVTVTGTEPATALRFARELRLLDEVGEYEVEEVCNEDVNARLRWLIETNRFESIVGDGSLYVEACREFFGFGLRFSYPRSVRSEGNSCLMVLAELLQPLRLADVVSGAGGGIPVVGSRSYVRWGLVRDWKGRRENGEPRRLVEFTHLVVRSAEGGWDPWRDDVEPWAKVVDGGYGLGLGKRLFSGIALVSMAVDEGEGPELEENTVGVFDPSSGLVRRLQFAKRRRSDEAWWLGQLEMNKGEAYIIALVAMLTWGDVDVISSVLEGLGDHMEELEAAEWVEFWSLYTIAVRAAKPQQGEVSEEWFARRGSIGGRFALAMTMRLGKGANRRRIGRECFYDYEGGDARILQTAAEWEVFSEGDEAVDWGFVDRLSRLARANNVGGLFPRRGMHGKMAVPSDVASNVLRECELHNDEWVGMCETALAAEVAARAPRVSIVAEEEGWFVEGDRR